MAEGPDPLGKRALYWMPVEAQVAPLGEHDVAVGPAVGSGPTPSPSSKRRARPTGKHALFSAATPASEHDEPTSSAVTTDPLPPRGAFVVTCSSCGSVSRVGIFDFVLLQLPVGFWLPRRTFDRWMTCPACRRRSWTSVTLAR
ncbi:MAG TPA: hypothetical protein VG054_00630 [Acidimicrobiales bacterium]|nr:hypothetical protein [Acidimicrobiales bacterium]